jgi:hypothetical protein
MYTFVWPGGANAQLCIGGPEAARAPSPRDVPFARGPVRRGPPPPIPAVPRRFVIFDGTGHYSTTDADVASRVRGTSAFLQGAVTQEGGPIPVPPVQSSSLADWLAVAARLPAMPISGAPDVDDAFHDPGVTP